MEMQKTILAILVVLGLAALGVAAQFYLVPTEVQAQQNPNPNPP
jgi:hypothetical protein